MTFPRRGSPILAGAVFLLACATAQAFEFKTVSSSAAILYDAPSIKGGKLFIAPRGMPVEIIVTYGDWLKVRDATGDLAWIEAKLLSSKRNVVIRSSGARVRANADDGATVVMTADKGVLLDLLESQSGWVKVRHRDGITGFVKASDIWGI